MGVVLGDRHKLLRAISQIASEPAVAPAAHVDERPRQASAETAPARRHVLRPGNIC